MLTCPLANNFIDFGFTVLMDTVLADRAELDFFLALLSPRPLRLVVLAPGIDVCKQRNASRKPQERFDFDGYEQLDADMNREFGDVGWWFDTSVLTPAETAERLVAEVTDRITPLASGMAHLAQATAQDLDGPLGHPAGSAQRTGKGLQVRSRPHARTALPPGARRPVRGETGVTKATDEPSFPS